MTDEHEAYKTLAAHIAERKKTEFESRKNIESRGAAIVTTSSALLALIFTLTVLISGNAGDQAKFTSHAAIVVLYCALGAFVMAAALGIYVQNSAWRYDAADDDTLKNFIGKNAAWNGSERDAARICASLDIDSIVSLRKGTQIKGIVGTVALALQGIAVALTVAALTSEFYTRGWF